MNDIEILLPATKTNEFYAQRLEDFEKYGLLNIKDIKVKLVLAVEMEYEDSDWPDNLDVNIMRCPHPHEACKVHHYYSTLTNKDVDQSKWFMRLDDDSITDISTLMDILGRYYDHKGEFYILSYPICHAIEQFEIDLLKEVGFDCTYHGIPHEVEACILSQGAMRKIINNETSMKLIKKRATIPHGYTDQCFASAARISKVFPHEAGFIKCCDDYGTPVLPIKDFSLLGGRFCHIHKVPEDNTKKQFFHTYLANRLSNNKINPFLRKFIDTNCIFYNNHKTHSGVIRLDPSGKILNSKHDNECFWAIMDDKLTFLNNDAIPTTIFTHKDAERNILQGEFLLDKNTQHFLLG